MMQKVVQQKHAVQAPHHIQMHAYCACTKQDIGREPNPKTNTVLQAEVQLLEVDSHPSVLFTSRVLRRYLAVPHVRIMGFSHIQVKATCWHCLRSKNWSYLSEPCRPLGTKGLQLILTSEQKLNCFLFFFLQSKQKGKEIYFFSVTFSEPFTTWWTTIEVGGHEGWFKFITSCWTVPPCCASAPPPCKELSLWF